MYRMHTRILAALATLNCAGVAHAQQAIDGVEKYAWAENLGYLNFADAGDPAGSQATILLADYLEGFAWFENAGYLNLGNGNGPYANTDHTDFGVNLDPVTGELTGFAWAENLGWVNFSGGAMADPPRPARIDFTARRWFGYAWSENAGWINFDDPDLAVVLACTADYNGDGVLDLGDIQAFVNEFLAADIAADLTGDGVLDLGDIQAFVALFLAGC